ncbi:hypothetical protein B296_00053233, partial [Ensete ventricosum]
GNRSGTPKITVVAYAHPPESFAFLGVKSRGTEAQGKPAAGAMDTQVFLGDLGKAVLLW